MMSDAQNKTIVYTDLDGTLLDSGTYSYQQAKPALELLAEKDIPVILCSSKTHSEISTLCKELNLDHPFISENGSAIFIPKNYFTSLPANLYIIEKYFVLRLGKNYQQVLAFFNELRKKFNLQAKGVHEMDLSEIRALTELDESGASMAKNRSFSEPFIITNPGILPDAVYQFSKKSGFKILRGNRFHHLLGNSDKGKAVRLLTELYVKNNDSNIKTIGIGDSPNDFDMLKSVDLPVLVRKQDGQYAQNMNTESLLITKKQGPAGWNEAIFSLVQ